MSKRQDPALRLMLVDDSVEEAEGIVTGLRNAGIAVRPLRPTTADELTTMLVEQPVDLVLAADPCRSVPFADVEQRVSTCGKDIPLIAVVAVMLGRSHPLYTAAACALFGSKISPPRCKCWQMMSRLYRPRNTSGDCCWRPLHSNRNLPSSKR